LSLAQFSNGFRLNGLKRMVQDSTPLAPAHPAHSMSAFGGTTT